MPPANRGQVPTRESPGQEQGGGVLCRRSSTILEIIPNGTTVKKGDVLCTLDASEYEDVALAQTIRVEQHKAEDVQTR